MIGGMKIFFHQEQVFLKMKTMIFLTQIVINILKKVIDVKYIQKMIYQVVKYMIFYPKNI